MVSQVYDRAGFTAALLAEHPNDFLNESPEDFADARYAVLCRDDSTSWVVAATDMDGVAAAVGELNANDNPDFEYLDTVYDLETGQSVDVNQHTIKVIVTRDGAEHFHTTRYGKQRKSWVIVVRHPEYENSFTLLPGDYPGVEYIDIDAGREFVDGGVTRQWCAEVYFLLNAPADVKREALGVLKDIAEDAPKRKRGTA